MFILLLLITITQFIGQSSLARAEIETAQQTSINEKSAKNETLSVRTERSISASGQIIEKTIRTRVRTAQDVDFEGSPIEGKSAKPNGSLLQSRPALNMDPLFNLKNWFLSFEQNSYDWVR